MAKDRQTPCLSYLSEKNPCKKDRIAEHSGYCQRCDKYEPRAKVRHLNLKKQKLQKEKNKIYD